MLFFCRVIAEMILDKVLNVVLVINLVKFLLCAFTCSYFDLYLLIGNKRMQKFLSPILLHGLCTVRMYLGYICTHYCAQFTLRNSYIRLPQLVVLRTKNKCTVDLVEHFHWNFTVFFLIDKLLRWTSGRETMFLSVHFWINFGPIKQWQCRLRA